MEIHNDYIDDIGIFFKTWKDYLKHVREVLKQLKNAKLKINVNKYYFAIRKMQFLGHLVGIDKIKSDSDNVIKIENFSRPKTVKEVWSFLGLSFYYQKFIRNFLKIVTSLFKLTKKDKQFLWINE